MSIDEELVIKIKEVTLKLHNMQKHIMCEIDLNPSEYKVLSVLALNGEMSQTALSEVCYMDKPATSRIIRKMHSASLINKTKKPGNKKIKYISLSSKGKEIAKQITEKHKDFKNTTFDNLNNDDKTILLNLINKILI